MGEKERLEAFEKMLGAVQRQFEETSEKMERLKAQDKTKSATYRQLMGNRFNIQEYAGFVQIIRSDRVDKIRYNN